MMETTYPAVNMAKSIPLRNHFGCAPPSESMTLTVMSLFLRPRLEMCKDTIGSVFTLVGLDYCNCSFSR